MLRYNSFLTLISIPLLLCLTAAKPTIASSCHGSPNGLPIVDLGYQVQQATVFNTTGSYYSFNNIRFAASPIGNLRFDAPQKPAVDRSSVQTGKQSRICPQAEPDWNAIAAQFLPRYLAGEHQFNYSSFQPATASLIPPDNRTTEDCLFLDVSVPKKIFNNAGHGPGAPVVVWIYGGGFTFGSKQDSGNPAGLIHASNEGIIFVALNYRLGAFGWLSGPTFQMNGTANIGLLDQRMGLDWVQEHIAKFGGDPKRVTIMGESAGGGSIVHHITAWGGGKEPSPFAQAIIQSPGFFPVASNNQQEDSFNQFLEILNVSTIQEARSLSTEKLQDANTKLVRGAPYGQFTVGPAVDGGYVPALPVQLLLHGQFDHNIRVMVGHNANEGLLFTTPFLPNASAVEQDLVSNLPTLKSFPKTFNHIIQDLYPRESASTLYNNPIGRSAAFKSDVAFLSNAFAVRAAFSNRAYGYLFNIPPSLHGQDVPYTFFNGPSPSVPFPHVAAAMQDYITQFIMTGNPNTPRQPFFGQYGANATIQVLNPANISFGFDPAANERNSWWQKVLYA